MTTDLQFDAEDLDTLDELSVSRGYILFLRLVAAELERQRADLERPLDPTATATCRGTIAALRMIPELVPNTRGEIASALKEK